MKQTRENMSHAKAAKKKQPKKKKKTPKPSIPDYCNLLGTNAQCCQISQVFRKAEKMDFLMLKYPNFFFPVGLKVLKIL